MKPLERLELLFVLNPTVELLNLEQLNRRLGIERLERFEQKKFTLNFEPLNLEPRREAHGGTPCHC